MISKKIMLLMILAILILLAAASATTLFGQPTSNGTLVGLEYTGPPGSTVIQSNTVVPTDKIQLISYAKHNETLSIKGIMFNGYGTQNITTKGANNTTITTPIKIMNNPLYFNTTIKITGREVETQDIKLPETLQKENVQITINGTTFNFYHLTSKSVIPTQITDLGITGIIIAIIIINSIMWIISLGIARGIINRIFYFPKSSKFTWTGLVFLLVGMYYTIYEEYYYEITSSYKDMAAIGVFAMAIYLWISLNIIPSKSSKIFVERFIIDMNTPKKEIMILYTGKANDGTRIAINPHSKREAFMRLIGINKKIKFKDKEGNARKDIDIIKNIDYDSSDMDIEGSYLMSPKITISESLKEEDIASKWKDQDPEWINYGMELNPETGEWERKKGIINRILSHFQKELLIPVSQYVQDRTVEHEAEKISYDQVIKELEDLTIKYNLIMEKWKQNGAIEGNKIYNEIEELYKQIKEKTEEKRGLEGKQDEETK